MQTILLPPHNMLHFTRRQIALVEWWRLAHINTHTHRAVISSGNCDTFNTVCVYWSTQLDNDHILWAWHHFLKFNVLLREKQAKGQSGQIEAWKRTAHSPTLANVFYGVTLLRDRAHHLLCVFLFAPFRLYVFVLSFVWPHFQQWKKRTCFFYVEFIKNHKFFYGIDEQCSIAVAPSSKSDAATHMILMPLAMRCFRDGMSAF